jgi:hypothetical protein
MIILYFLAFLEILFLLVLYETGLIEITFIALVCLIEDKLKG